MTLSVNPVTIIAIIAPAMVCIRVWRFLCILAQATIGIRKNRKAILGVTIYANAVTQPATTAECKLIFQN
jgi:hypothetical protein